MERGIAGKHGRSSVSAASGYSMAGILPRAARSPRRRSCAERLINLGVSAETLMVIMRHRDFATTRKFYGAKRAAQAAATEIHQKLVVSEKADELVRDVEQAGQLTSEELKALKRLLNSIRQPEADSQNG